MCEPMSKSKHGLEVLTTKESRISAQKAAEEISSDQDASTINLLTRNGIPQLPTNPDATPVTSEMIRKLQEEDDHELLGGALLLHSASQECLPEGE